MVISPSRRWDRINLDARLEGPFPAGEEVDI
jgi:hypothetical protein